MKPQTSRLRSLLALFTLGWASSMSAQTVVDNANEQLELDDPASEFAEGQLAPTLYEGEIEDVGPQYLLIPRAPSHEWFATLLDLQWFNSTNPTLADDSDRRSADLMVATAQFGFRPPAISKWDGQLKFLGGYRHQYFEYGEITGDETLINGVPVNRSDFQGHTFFVDGNWSKKSWRVTAGLRHTTLDNRTGGSNFYNETVLSWGLSKNYSFGKNTLVTLAYDGAAYFTESSAGAIFFRDDFNDRTSHAIGARLLYRLNKKVFIQPNARLNYSDYSNDLNGEREDLTASLGTTLSYYINSDTVARVFANYQTRDSNGAGVSDYSNFDAGIGGSFSFNF